MKSFHRHLRLRGVNLRVVDLRGVNLRVINLRVVEDGAVSVGDSVELGSKH